MLWTPNKGSGILQNALLALNLNQDYWWDAAAIDRFLMHGRATMLHSVMILINVQPNRGRLVWWDEGCH